jgi:hypothetical protein
MAASTLEPEQAGPQAGLLDAVRADRADRDAAEVRMLRHVLEYCAAHEVPESEAATYVEFGHDTGLALAGAGAPCVSEFAVIELAAALGMTPDGAKRHVGHVLEVRYRLPRLWELVTAGRLPFWRAGRIAEHTITLPTEAAAHVDRQLAPVADKVGVRQTERLCQEALAHFDPDAAEERRQAAMDRRRVEVHSRDADPAGTLDISATTDTADGLDLDTALNQVAAELKAAGCTEPLDVRRSMALGLLARRQLGLDLNYGREGSGPLVKPRQVTINVHLHDQQIGRCETTRSPITVEQVKGWCTNPDTQVNIRPIKDLNDHIRVDQYEVPDRLDDQVTERDGTCVFPWCTRPVQSCDDDHTVPYERGGPTCSCNIAPVCRTHHRAKTHDGWVYRFIRPGSYLWVSPHGYWHYRDGTGTTDLGHQGPAGHGFGDPPHPRTPHPTPRPTGGAIGMSM